MDQNADAFLKATVCFKARLSVNDACVKQMERGQIEPSCMTHFMEYLIITDTYCDGVVKKGVRDSKSTKMFCNSTPVRSARATTIIWDEICGDKDN